MLGYEPGRTTLQPKRIRSHVGAIHWKSKGGKVNVPIIPGWDMARADGKGRFWIANLATGQLMLPTPDGGWISTDGIHNEYALADGRAKQLYGAISGSPITLTHIAVLCGIILVLLAVLAWKFFQG